VTSFSDNFNRADSTDLGANWVEVSGDWSIVSNQLSTGDTGGTIVLRAATAMAGNDNYAQVTLAATAAVSQGVWCRGNANITNGYLWRNDGTSWDLFSVVSSSFNVIGTFAGAAAPGDVAKVQAVGSTIKGLVNGVERVSVTDTAISTGTSVGIRSVSSGSVRYDDFAAGDVAATVTGSAAAGFGALTATVTGVRSVSGTAAAAFGALTGTASSTVSGTALGEFSALTATATGSAPSSSGPGNSRGWWGLLSIRAEAAAYARDERTTAPVACPYDGEPLDAGRNGVLACPWGNYEWPRDGRII
jgi:hypothetical protein